MTVSLGFSRLAGGNPYQVRVVRQPTNPAQVCTVGNAAGVVEDRNIIDVAVVCT